MCTHQVLLSIELMITIGQWLLQWVYILQYVMLYTRGEPGIDWDINNPSQFDITKVFYSVYDSTAVSSLSM